MMKDKLTGIFANEDEAIQVIECLRTMGYLDENVSVIAKNTDRLDDIEDETKVEMTNVNVVEEANTALGVPPVAPVAPAGSGEAGGVLLDYGLFALPGTQAFSARGPVAATYTALEDNDPLDQIARSLVSNGIDKDDAESYKSYIDRGDILIIVDEKSQLEKDKVLQCYKENNNLI